VSAVLSVALAIGATAPGLLVAQDACPQAVNAIVQDGWTRYQQEQVDSAYVLFAAAVQRCPNHVDANVGAGYTLLRRNRVDEAERRFRTAITLSPSAADAWFGLALIARRRGNASVTQTALQRVLALDSTRVDAHEMLSAILPPERPPLVLPDTVEMRSRARGEEFQVLVDGAWESFYIKGVNLGAALPGKFPSEFPDSATYAAWIAAIAEMRANTIRVYTIHPPHFYQALATFNRAHPDAPIWLIHGVWTELPPNHDFADSVWNADFTAEMHRVVDILHGRADIMTRPGHASGYYTADVSPWTLGYIIGREWEPYAVVAFDAANPGSHDWEGEFLRVMGGSATDVWLTQACDRLVAYETHTYRTQRPIAYTSWPTLDPLYHPTEASIAEDMAMRGRVDTDAVAEQHDEDVATIDPSKVSSTGAFAAGFFASYHAYPYYPDFVIHEGGYAAYLRRLKAHHTGMPLVIAEYGVPASLAIAHLSPEGWHHGGHSEARMAAIDAELTELLERSGMAGGILFAWIDEWFKRNWLVMNLERPQERARLWLNRMNPEQQYGVIAMEPAPRLVGPTLADRLASWEAVPELYPGRMRVLADEAYLRLLVWPGPAGADTILVGFDVWDRGAGSFRWPGGRGPELPYGVEFVVRVTATDARILADPRSNPFRVRRQPTFRLPLEYLDVANPPPGLFQGPFDQVPNYPLGGMRNTAGRFDSLRVVVNRVRLGRDSVERAATGYDWGVLRHGEEPDGIWERDPATGAVEIRVPWTLITVSDPSSRRVLTSPTTGGGYVGTAVDGIGIVLGLNTAGGEWEYFPGRDDTARRFTWDAWEEPAWRARRRPVFDAMRAVFERLDRGSVSR
jgi:Tfp pilus assembly protein PilF